MIENRHHCLQLVRPAPQYLDSYREACQETFAAVHNSYILHNPDTFAQWKETIFADFDRQEHGIDLPSGILPSATFWLVDKARFIGAINIRLQLNDALKDYGGTLGCFIRKSERRKGYAAAALPLAIDRARQLGVDPILVTCIESNTGSLRSLLATPCRKMQSAVTVADGVRTRIWRFWF